MSKHRHTATKERSLRQDRRGRPPHHLGRPPGHRRRLRRPVGHRHRCRERHARAPLNLTLTADVGVEGFSNFTGKMAPGDTDNVYVNLNNTGTLASAAGMTLAVAGHPVERADQRLGRR